MQCNECGATMVETEPRDEDLWFGEPAGPVYECPECGTLEAEAA